jgi:hypothetical protein
VKALKHLQNLILALALALACAPLAHAATTNIPVAVPGVVLIPLHFDGQFTATTNPVAKFVLPFGARLLGVSANARASGGTSPTLTVDVEDDGTTVLSSAIAITAGTPAEGTVSVPEIADESVIEIVLTIGGTSPTWDDITVLLTVVRN